MTKGFGAGHALPFCPIFGPPKLDKTMAELKRINELLVTNRSKHLKTPKGGLRKLPARGVVYRTSSPLCSVFPYPWLMYLCVMRSGEMVRVIADAVRANMEGADRYSGNRCYNGAKVLMCVDAGLSPPAMKVIGVDSWSVRNWLCNKGYVTKTNELTSKGEHALNEIKAAIERHVADVWVNISDVQKQPYKK